MWRSIGFMALAALALCPERASALANPASVFCVESGGRTEIRQGPKGEYGVCILPNGRAVDEWSYYRRHRGRMVR
jgi:uncharacterized protein